jgi:hypothetical protein
MIKANVAQAIEANPIEVIVQAARSLLQAHYPELDYLVLSGFQTRENAPPLQIPIFNQRVSDHQTDASGSPVPSVSSSGL